MNKNILIFGIAMVLLVLPVYSANTCSNNASDYIAFDNGDDYTIDGTAGPMNNADTVTTGGWGKICYSLTTVGENEYTTTRPLEQDVSMKIWLDGQGWTQMCKDVGAAGNYTIEILATGWSAVEGGWRVRVRDTGGAVNNYQMGSNVGTSATNWVIYNGAAWQDTGVAMTGADYRWKFVFNGSGMTWLTNNSDGWDVIIVHAKADPKWDMFNIYTDDENAKTVDKIMIYEGEDCPPFVDVNAPVISNYNLTIDGNDNLGNTSWNDDNTISVPVVTGRPTLTFNTDEPANCSVRTINQSYNVTYPCQITNGLNQICKLYYIDKLVYGVQNLYAGCDDASDNHAYSPALSINMTAGSFSQLISCIIVGEGCTASYLDGCYGIWLD